MCIRDSVDAFHTRASHYHAGECLRQLAALNSRLNCAQEMARRDSVGEVPPVPVSYTHLDVYKRQSLYRAK